MAEKGVEAEQIDITQYDNALKENTTERHTSGTAMQCQTSVTPRENITGSTAVVLRTTSASRTLNILPINRRSTASLLSWCLEKTRIHISPRPGPHLSCRLGAAT